MSEIFHTILTEPLLNLLVLLYNTVGFEDVGISIILLTLLVRIVLFPFFHKSLRHQRKIQALQPKLKEIQKKYKEDRVKQSEEMMALYKKEKTNPFSGMLFLIIQLPILIALYIVFRQGLTPDVLSGLYPIISKPNIQEPLFLGLLNLNNPSILMLLTAAGAQYIQGKLSLPKKENNSNLTQAEKIGRNMVYMGPVITIIFFYSLPAAVTLYWLTNSVFSVGQQLVIKNKEEKSNNHE